jgi:hypothetical protein
MFEDQVDKEIDSTSYNISHYFSRPYYGSEIWYQVTSSANRNRLSSVHYYPLKLVLKCFKSKISRREMCTLLQIELQLVI